MGKDIGAAVREVCLWPPEAEEVPSRGSPDFRVRGKTFGTYTVNHHGDGRLALWLVAPDGAQQLYTESDPDSYFVPPYVGPKGWLGVNLDRGLDWGRIADHVREAYVMVAPKTLISELGPTIDIEPPTETIDPELFDPLVAPRALEVLESLREFCGSLPETSEGRQFGDPAFKAGKKTFLTVHRRYQGRLILSFWVGADMQAMLTFEERYTIPHYTGHNGWIALDVEDTIDWDEVHELILVSYRHFALKRMLKTLDG